jgi:hypothetical protein
VTDWKIYRTRFLVKATRLCAQFAVTDSLGRVHHGHEGDYLVQGSDGSCRIAPRHVFEDIYVELEPSADLPPLAASPGEPSGRIIKYNI